MDAPRVEQQAELAIPRERAFELLSTAAGLASWLDGADVDGAEPGERCACGCAMPWSRAASWPSTPRNT